MDHVSRQADVAQRGPCARLSPDHPTVAALGLSASASRLYTQLLRRPSAGEGDVAELTASAGPEADQAIAELHELGLVVRRDGALIAAPPAVAVEALLLGRMRELESARLGLPELQQDYREHVAVQASVDVGEVVVGTVQIQQRYSQLIRTARREIRMLDAPFGADLGGCLPDVSVRAAGVRCRAVYSSVSLGQPAVADLLAQHRAAGEPVRALAELPLAMVLADEQIAMLPLVVDAGGTSQAAVCVLARPMLLALVSLFDLIWDKAWPLGHGHGEAASTPGSASVAAAGPQLSEQEQRLLVLVATGLTDAAIARQLGVGARTVQRRLHGLSHRLGTRNRLDLMRVAIRHGWL